MKARIRRFLKLTPSKATLTRLDELAALVRRQAVVRRALEIMEERERRQ